MNQEFGSWKKCYTYLVPQETSQGHPTTMTVQAAAVQTEEHDEKQNGVGGECDNSAESDAVEVEHTAGA